MAEFTEDELRRLAQSAYDRGDVARARTFIGMMQEAGEVAQNDGASRPTYDPNGDIAVMRPPRADAPLGEAPPRQTSGDRLIGDVRGVVDRAAPVAGDLVRSTASGLAQGVEGLANIASAPGRALDRALGVGPGAQEGSVPPASALMRGTDAGEALLSYIPETTAGRYAQTTARYAPGAVAFGGGGLANAGGNVLRYAVAPGIAEEAAGQAAERAFGPDSAAESIIRPVAGLAAGVAAARPTGQVRPVIPRADAEDARLAEVLTRHGITPSVGQATQSEGMRRLEGTLGTGSRPIAQFNRAIMRLMGSRANRATPDAMQQAVDDIVRRMDDAIDGVSMTPTTQMAQRAQDILDEYVEMLPGGQANVTPAVRRIAEEIIEAATSPNPAPVSLEVMRAWRRRLGSLMGSNDDQVRTAAYGLRSLINDATEGALQAAGRGADVARLAEANNHYRNWLAAARAVSRSGNANGIISPGSLEGAVTQQQGWKNVATGATTDLGELSRAANAILRPLPTVEAGGVRHITGASTALGALAGQQSAQNPVLGAAIGYALPSTGQAILRSNPLQNLMMDPRGQFANALLGTSSGVGAN